MGGIKNEGLKTKSWEDLFRPLFTFNPSRLTY